MGYSERICQLCSTSFNIARIRRSDEPVDAAWLEYGYDFVESSTDCDAEDCSVVYRPRREPGGEDNEVEDEVQGGEADEVPEREEPRENDGVENGEEGEGEDGARDEDKEGEHIAGPHCESTTGYSGHRISVEEMKGCQSVQCIMRKDDDWSPEPGDEDFVVQSETCWLTGISKGPPDEFEIDGLEPVLHGVDSTLINDAPEEGSEWGYPVHPHCFQIFSRLSRLAFGTVNLDGLRRHWDARGDRFDHLQNWTKSTDIPRALQQWFSHVPGTEYLVAHPLEVSGLQALIDGCLWGDQQREETVFPTAVCGDHDSDPFTRLSPELVMMVIAQLPRRDVANLRLASRVFRQLPQTYFQTLVSSEMPWMSWELDSLPPKDVNWHKLWCDLSDADGGARRDEAVRPWREYLKFPDRISETWVEILPELEQEELKGFMEGPGYYSSWGIPEGKEERVKEIVAKYMPPGESSWPSPKQLHGLRNRRRIYEDLQDAINKIKALDEEEVVWCLKPSEQ